MNQMSQRVSRPTPHDADLAEIGAAYRTEQITTATTTAHYRATIVSIETDRVIAVAEAHEDDISDPERQDLGQNVDVALHRAVKLAIERTRE